jgi:hypothetical protein
MDLLQLIEDDDRLPAVAVPTPEWPQVDGKLFVSVLTAEERGRFADMATDDAGKPQPTVYEAALVAFAARDAEGNRCFGESKIKWLASRNGLVVRRLYNAAARLNGMTPEAREELEKN